MRSAEETKDDAMPRIATVCMNLKKGSVVATHAGSNNVHAKERNLSSTALSSHICWPDLASSKRPAGRNNVCAGLDLDQLVSGGSSCPWFMWRCHKMLEAPKESTQSRLGFCRRWLVSP